MSVVVLGIIGILSYRSSNLALLYFLVAALNILQEQIDCALTVTCERFNHTSCASLTYSRKILIDYARQLLKEA